MKLLTAKETREYFKITPATLSRWKMEGKIKAKEFSSRKFLYDVDSFCNIPDRNNVNVIYARVSNKSQEELLDSQIDTVKKYAMSNGYSVSKIYKDVCCGISEHRPALKELLVDAFNRNIDNVFILSPDRMTLFGFDYVKNVLEASNVGLHILDTSENVVSEYKLEIKNDLKKSLETINNKLNNV